MSYHQLQTGPNDRMIMMRIKTMIRTMSFKIILTSAFYVLLAAVDTLREIIDKDDVKQRT